MRAVWLQEAMIAEDVSRTLSPRARAAAGSPRGFLPPAFYARITLQRYPSHPRSHRFRLILSRICDMSLCARCSEGYDAPRGNAPSRVPNFGCGICAMIRAALARRRKADGAVRKNIGVGDKSSSFVTDPIFPGSGAVRADSASGRAGRRQRNPRRADGRNRNARRHARPHRPRNRTPSARSPHRVARLRARSRPC